MIPIALPTGLITFRYTDISNAKVDDFRRCARPNLASARRACVQFIPLLSDRIGALAAPVGGCHGIALPRIAFSNTSEIQ